MRLPRILLRSAVFAALTAGGAQAAGFTADQRAEIVHIVRDALKQDPSILRDALAAVQADDAHQHETASAAAIAAQRPALVANPGDPVAGNPSGDVTIVEFYDPRCPYCKQMVPVIAEALQADPGLRIVYKDIPILGPPSVLESRSLLAAQKQGRYVQMQKAVMASSTPLSLDDLRSQADKLGLDGARLQRDMNDPAINARIEDNLRLAAALGVEGTPALIIGDRMIPGSMTLGELQNAVAALRTHR